MSNNFKILVAKIERFIKKYYFNQLIKGFIYSAFLLALLLLVLSGIEYFAYLKTTVRLVLFYTYLITSAYVLARYIFIPVYKLVSYRKAMPIEVAASEIGKHFPEVQDKLLNTIQLRKSAENQPFISDLLIAGIEQKIARLRPIPFNNAVDLRKNLHYLRYGLIPVVALLTILVLFPAFVIEPTKRIAQYNTSFSKPLPFEVQVMNNDFDAVQHEDFEVKVRVTGTELPAQMTIVFGGFRNSMTRLNTNEFSYVFRKLTQDITFRIETVGYSGMDYQIQVFPKPVLLSYLAEVDFPGYTNRSDEVFRDLTRIAVPIGSSIQWQFNTRDSDQLNLISEQDFVMDKVSANRFQTQHKAMTNTTFRVKPANKYDIDGGHLDFSIDIIPDEYPLIEVRQADSDEFDKNRFYTGMISDDYGFSRLSFVFTTQNPASNAEPDPVVRNIPIDRNRTNQQFYYFFSADSLNVEPGDRINYYFEVWDNDAVNGPKSKRSNVFVMEILSNEQLDSVSKKMETSIAERMDDALRESTELKREIDEFMRELMQKRDLDWSDRNKMKDLVEKQKKLQQEISDLANERDKLNQFDRENNRANEQILEKQEQISKLFDELIPDDIRKMMEEIQDLMNELNKDQVQDMLKNMQMNNEQFEQMLDRNLALLKQLQVEKAMNDLINDLDKLADALEKNAEETASESQPDEKLSEKLEEISHEFDSKMNTLDSLRKENQNLQRPFKLDDTKEEEKSISDELDKADEQLQRDQKQQSGGSQKRAAGEMKKMKDNLAMMMMQSQQQQQAEDARSMRILLENIVRSSLKQEDILELLGTMRRDDPAYVDVIKDQTELRQSFKIVEDSLLALSKRQPMVENFILNEVDIITERMNAALSGMHDRQTSAVLQNQQFSMMSLNNLGLMLAEALKNLQDSMGMSSPMQGDGQCESGNSGGNSIQNMRELQEALGEQMNGLMDGENGSEGGKPGLSEEIARMAAEQEAIRQQLQNYLNELKAQGEGGSELQEILEDMDKLEEDLVNRRINQELLERQQDIVVRLLESERAEKERELDEQRESNEFKGENLSNPSDFFEYKRIIEMQRDELRLAPVELQPFYRNRVSNYFLRTNELIYNE